MAPAMGVRGLQAALALCVGLALVAVVMHSGAQPPSELVQVPRHARRPFVPARIALAKQLQATREVMQLLRKAPGIGSYEPVVKPSRAHKNMEMRKATKRFAALEDKTMQAAGAMYRSFKKEKLAASLEAADQAKVRADARALKTVLTRRELIRSVYDFDVNEMKSEQRRAAQLLGLKRRARTMKKASFQPEFAKTYLPEPEQGDVAEEVQEGEDSEEAGEEGQEEKASNRPYGLFDEVPGTAVSYNLTTNNNTEPAILDSEQKPPWIENGQWEDEAHPGGNLTMHVPTALTPFFGDDDLRGEQPERLTPFMRKVDHHTVKMLFPDEMKAGEEERIRQEKFAHVPHDTFPNTGEHEEKLLYGVGEAGQKDPMSMKSMMTDTEMPAEEAAGERKNLFYGSDARATGEPMSDYLVNGADPTNGVDRLGMVGVKE